MLARPQYLRHKDNSCSRQQGTAKDKYCVTVVTCFASLSHLTIFLSLQPLLFICNPCSLLSVLQWLRSAQNFPFFSVRTLVWANKPYWSLPKTTEYRDELKLPHNSEEVGGGSRTLRIKTLEAEASEKRNSGCVVEKSLQDSISSH